jgi:hypothetical protein
MEGVVLSTLISKKDVSTEGWHMSLTDGNWFSKSVVWHMYVQQSQSKNWFQEQVGVERDNLVAIWTEPVVLLQYFLLAQSIYQVVRYCRGAYIYIIGHQLLFERIEWSGSTQASCNLTFFVPQYMSLLTNPPSIGTQKIILPSVFSVIMMRLSNTYSFNVSLLVLYDQSFK